LRAPLSRCFYIVIVHTQIPSCGSHHYVHVYSDSSDMASICTSIVEVEKPEDLNVIVGMTHFIKTVDDIHEALVGGAVPGIKFGLGFCEASGDRLVRWSGTDDALIELAKKNAKSIGCGHSFILFLAAPTFPIHILNTIKMVPEVCRIFCATANKVQLIVAETTAGRGIMGVIDGQTPLGVETEEDIKERRDLLKKFGYKL
jgi:adenosine/AMP kinase